MISLNISDKKEIRKLFHKLVNRFVRSRNNRKYITEIIKRKVIQGLLQLSRQAKRLFAAS